MGLSGSLTGTDGVALISIGSCVGFCRVQGLHSAVRKSEGTGGVIRFAWWALEVLLLCVGYCVEYIVN